jgi:hypothetical protein
MFLDAKAMSLYLPCTELSSGSMSSQSCLRVCLDSMLSGCCATEGTSHGLANKVFTFGPFHSI